MDGVNAGVLHPQEARLKTFRKLKRSLIHEPFCSEALIYPTDQAVEVQDDLVYFVYLLFEEVWAKMMVENMACLSLLTADRNLVKQHFHKIHCEHL